MKSGIITLEGKKINLEWIDGERADSRAYFLKDKITLTKVMNTVLNPKNPKELQAILLHERGHLEWYNFCLPFIPIFLIIVLLLFTVMFNPFTRLVQIILVFLFVFSLVLLIYLLRFKEILADRYACARTDKTMFKRALIKVYKFNRNISSKNVLFISKIWNRISYPPFRKRIFLIDNFKTNAIKKSLK